MVKTKRRKGLTLQDMEQEAKRFIRTDMPYGMLQNRETGGTVFFNRDYRVIEFNGRREFPIDPKFFDIAYTSIVDCNYVQCNDGTKIWGCSYYLYDSATAPYVFKSENIIRYIHILRVIFGS